MSLTRTLSFRAKLSRSTHASLEAFLEEMRALWNAALEERIDRAFAAFFRRHAAGLKPGFPRFRSKHRGVHSFEVPAPKIQRQGRFNVVSVKGIGKFRFAGEIDGTPKVMRIVKTPIRVIVQIVVEREAAEIVDLRAPTGIDAGIRYRAALSTGQTVPGRKLDRSEIVRRQRILSRAKRGSKARCKKRQALARSWQKTRERERGMLHELTAERVRGHGARFYVEDLKIPNMLRNRHLARSIAEQNWGTFVSLLTYKAEEAGGWVRKVPPHHRSQLCSACGAMPEVKLTLADRTYECGACGHAEDRDGNAAKNILQVGLRLHPPGGASPGAPGGAAGLSGGQRTAGRKAERSVTARNGIGGRTAQPSTQGYKPLTMERPMSLRREGDRNRVDQVAGITWTGRPKSVRCADGRVLDPL